MSYWGEKGKYQELADKMDKAIPVRGEATDTRVEMVRVARNVYYDIFNNGGCNLMDGWARNNELNTLLAKFPSDILEEYMEIYEEEQNHEDVDSTESDAMFDQVCDEMDKIMDRVLEWVKSTGYFEQEEEDEA